MIGNVWDYNKKSIVGNAFRYDKKHIIGNSIFFPAADRLPLFWDYHNEDQSLQGADLLTSYVGPVPDGRGGLADEPITPDGLFTGPDYTNLFTTSPSAPEAVILTVQDYTLVCIGGSVSSSYGTATEAAPLTFTAAAGSTTFIPTDVDGWLLVASSYVLPVVPPATSVPSTAATSGGNGASFLMDENVVDVLRGETDGVELWDDPTPVTINEDNYSTYNSDTGICRIVSDLTENPLLFQSNIVTAGKTYIITVSDYNAAYGTIKLNNPAVPITGNGEYEYIPTTGAVYVARSSACDVSFKLSAQKLNPAVGTIAALVKMGVGSDELIGDTVQKNIASVNDSAIEAMIMSRGAPSDPDSKIVTAYDGATFNAIAQSWSRGETHLKIVQYNGTQFRLGSFRYGVDSPIQWSSLVAFDGSFNPLDYLRLAFNGTVPLYFQQLQVWSESDVADAEILKLSGRYI